MKTIGQLVANPNELIEKHVQSKYEQAKGDEQAKAVVDKVFASLTAIKPAWRHALPDQPAVDKYKQQMVKAIIDAGITTQAEVAMGVARARLEPTDFMPSTGKFVQWCRPSLDDHGLPPSKQAAREYMRNRHIVARGDIVTWSHPAVYVAGNSINKFDLDRMEEREFLETYEYNYDVACQRVFSGEDLNQEIPKPLPNKVNVPLTDEEIKASNERGKKALSAMMDMVRDF